MILLVWLLYILGDAVANWYMIEKKKISPHHGYMTVFRGWFAIMFGILIDTQADELLFFLGYTMGAFWLLFDPLLNLMRGKKFFYIGETAAIDKLGGKYPILYWTFKIIILIITIVSFVRLL
jgi:hypothetical protein